MNRGLLGITDPQLRRIAQSEDYVLVTNNGSDFKPMYRREDIHPGLIVLPGDYGRERQQRLAGQVLDP